MAVLVLLIALDYAAGLIVEVGANSARGLDVLKVFEEFVELGQAHAEVFHADGSILVEVEAQVIILHEDLHVGVGAAHVGNELLLALVQHANEHADEVSRLVVIEDNLLWQLLDLLEDLCALTLHRLVLLHILDVWIRELVRLASLDVAEALAAFIQPQVEEVFSDDLEALQNLNLIVAGHSDCVSALRLCCGLAFLLCSITLAFLRRRYRCISRSFWFFLAFEVCLAVGGLWVNVLDSADGALHNRG